MADAKILLLTADANLASSCSQAFGAKFDAVHEHDGEAALMKAARARFAAFVIDLELPNTDALHVVSALRGYGPTRNAAVIAIAAKRTDDLVELVRHHGCDRVLARPIDPKGVAQHLDELLARRVSYAA